MRNREFTLQDAKVGLIIDKDDLDSAIIQQSVLFYDVSQELVSAKENRDRSKDGMERVEAELSGEFRMSLLDNKEKVTEARLKELVASDAEFRKARTLYLSARNVVDSWESMKEAYSQRSFMIRELAHLWAANYYGDPTVSGKSGAIGEIVDRTNRRKIADDRNKRVRVRNELR